MKEKVVGYILLTTVVTSRNSTIMTTKGSYDVEVPIEVDNEELILNINHQFL